jgi:hypothetical protein
MIDKSTLWIFGDSFAGADYEVSWRPWQQLLADRLDMQLVNLGKSGSSQSYTLYEMMRTQDEWTSRDLVIVTMTKIERTWLLEDLPQVGSMATLENIIKHHEEQFRPHMNKFKAVFQYYIHLLNEKQQRTQSQAFLYAIDVMGRKLDNKPLVLPSFDDVLEASLTWPEGISSIGRCLYSYALEEYLDSRLENIYMGKIGMDMRCNHFIQDNHRRLADAFVAYTSTGKLDIDLVKGVITADTMMDDAFRTAQFATLSDIEIKGMLVAEREYRKRR